MKLAIVTSAIRENRKTPRLAHWVYKTAQEADNIDVETIDLKDYNLPIFNEPVSPRYNPNREIVPEAQRWLDRLAEFDAYIFVTPEYNHSIPGALKNAFDYIDWQLNRKPATVVSHGSAGGARAEVALKEIISESRAVPMPTIPGLAITSLDEIIDDQGNMSEKEKANPYGSHGALVSMLKELKWYSDALAPARDK